MNSNSPDEPLFSMSPSSVEEAHIPTGPHPSLALPPIRRAAPPPTPFTYNEPAGSSPDEPARQDEPAVEKPFNMALYALQPHHPHANPHVDTSTSSGSAPQPPTVVTSSDEPPTQATAATSVSQQNPPEAAVKQEEEAVPLSGFVGNMDARAFKQFADMEIGCPRFGVDKLIVEALHELCV
ncbi:hypothetical protein CALVIDRAFT_165722 [Calocera viscosa TUFC12733]|uniref:Uncharacterized protein n=1 Tax=Calocera viscosa (strain TUFC12733) TaxID=1330018 RepID=A0A167LGB9_CALVF|nr:hypothetical protein CALVIDRAFT_165722 [Calocera viscosa TUFC12733]